MGTGHKYLNVDSEISFPLTSSLSYNFCVVCRLKYHIHLYCAYQELIVQLHSGFLLGSAKEAPPVNFAKFDCRRCKKSKTALILSTHTRLTNYWEYEIEKRNEKYRARRASGRLLQVNDVSNRKYLSAHDIRTSCQLLEFFQHINILLYVFYSKWRYEVLFKQSISKLMGKSKDHTRRRYIWKYWDHLIV